MKKRLKINGVIIFFAVLLVLKFPGVFFRNGQGGFAEEIAKVFGFSFILLGQLFRVSARGYKSENSQNGASLIQGGPYNLVRNPMYLGILLIGLGVVLLLFQWWVSCVFLSIFVIRYILLIFQEEKKLESVFGKDYEKYKTMVPRLFPSPACLAKKEIAEYLPLRLSWVKKELNSIFPVLAAALVILSWEDISNSGLTIYFKELSALFLVAVLFFYLILYLGKKTAFPKKDA
ncbi:MAG: isoprenylcysteine carboxylmethyltransferase family protein [Candidatus Omnitrophica bacterium]|nr:isoprenylcysteine carboxylmethyltransferase family protein [Candidatus Omnitrophota bacterium]